MKQRSLRRAALTAAGAASLLASIAMAAQTPKCGTPVVDGLPAYTAGSSATISWSSPPMASDGYIVEVADNPSFVGASSDGSVTASPYTATGLSESIHYFRVKAKTDSQGRCLSSPFSNTVSTTQDATAPDVTGTPSRLADSNDWYNAELTVAWSGSDSGSGLASCSSDSSYSGPDTTSVTLPGSCTDNVGNVGHGSFDLAYDAGLPSVTANPSREPDSNGWYNHEFEVSFSGSDDMSGIAFCSPTAVIAGPDTGSGEVTGDCTDVADNSNSATLLYKYDATGPTTSIDVKDIPLVVGLLGDTVSGSASDNISGVASTSVVFTNLLGESTTVAASCDCGATSTTWTASTAGLLPGIYTVTASSTDVAGNAGGATAPVTIIVI